MSIETREKGFSQFCKDVMSATKEEEEMGGFMVPKESMPLVRMYLGMCPICGHVWPGDQDKCSNCSHGIDDEIIIGDVVGYDGKDGI